MALTKLASTRARLLAAAGAICIAACGDDRELKGPGDCGVYAGADTECPEGNAPAGGMCQGGRTCPLTFTAECADMGSAPVYAVCQEGAWKHVVMGECAGQLRLDDAGSTSEGKDSDGGTDDAGTAR